MKHRFVDVNVYLSRWPCRRLPCDDPQRLVEKLRAANITQAWAGSFDALLHKDVRAVNARLVDECQQFAPGLLMPVGAINPRLPGWRDDLEECHARHQMKVIRLHPNYHAYPLTDPVFQEVLQLASEKNLVVQIAVRMEDPRTQNSLLQIPDVDVMPLRQQLPQFPNLKILLLNALARLQPTQAERLAIVGNVFFEIAMLEGVGGISRWLKTLSGDRLLFGSYFPFYQLESALLKLRESSLGGLQRIAITSGNAASLLGESS